MATPTSLPRSSRKLQQGFLVILLLGIAIVSIYLRPGQEHGPVRTEQIALATLPSGIGRGFPIVALDQSDNRATGIEVGDQAPTFQLVLDDGRYLELADFAGRPVLINFWATWCGPCRLEMPELVAEANRNQDLVLLAVNVQEERERLEPFAEDFQMNMPIVQDANGDLRDLYGVRGMPTSVFIDRDGRIAHHVTGILTPQSLQGYLSGIDAQQE